MGNLVCLPSWNVLRGVAPLRLLVKDLPQGTTLLPGRNAVQADVELLAVLRVGVDRMCDGLAVAVSLGVLGTGESVL